MDDAPPPTGLTTCDAPGLSPGDGPVPPGGGLWVDDEFLWDLLPRLSPLDVYVYLAVGRHQSRARYPSARDLAAELTRGPRLVRDACLSLRRAGLFNDGDLDALLGEGWAVNPVYPDPDTTE